MTVEKAIRLLGVEYARAKRLIYVRNPLAYALYQTWKQVDRQGDQPKGLFNREKGETKMVSSNILIWNEDFGFIKINEGTGDNLLNEDVEQGFVDYILIEGAEYDGCDLVESQSFMGDGMILLTELYQEMFNSAQEVINYLIDTGWLPDDKYIILSD